jgi:hypothetical protein
MTVIFLTKIHFGKNCPQSLINKGAQLDPLMGLTGRCCVGRLVWEEIHDLEI